MIAVEINVASYAVLFVLLTTQVYVLLWAAGAVAGIRSTAGRLVGGAMLGAAHDILVDLAAFGVFGEISFLGSWFTVMGVSVATFLVAYWPLPRRRFFAALGYYYLLAFLGAGAAYAVANVTHIGWLGPAAALAVTLAAGELGWGIVQHWLWQQLLYVPVVVELLGRSVEATALVDTGNSLRDPLSGAPVLILNEGLCADLLPEELSHLSGALCAGDVSVVTTEIAASPAAARIRLVPYSSLGCPSGMLVAFRPDSAYIRHSGVLMSVGEVLVGFHRGELAPDGSYQALIHPALVSRVVRRLEGRGIAVNPAGTVDSRLAGG